VACPLEGDVVATMPTTRVHDRLVALLSRGPIPSNNFEPNHHLWRKGRVWWTALTVYADGRTNRVQRSLRTADVVEARRLRDELIDDFIERGLVVVLRPGSGAR